MTNEKRISIDQYFWDDNKRFSIDQYFWADQISLNQQNDLERDHQVSLMSTIYTEASFVFAWLGLASQPAPVCTAAFSAVWDPFAEMKRDSFTLLLQLCAHEYWQRLWIIQELRLAREVVIWHDVHTVDAALFLHKCECMARPLFESKRNHYAYDDDIAERLRIFKLDIFPKIQSLLMSDRQFLMPPGQYSILKCYYSSHCSDPRDKFFGLQSLVEPKQRIVIDYILNEHQVAIQVLKSILLYDILNANGKVSLCDYKHRHLPDRIRSITNAILILSPHAELASAMAWSLLVPCIPGDIQMSVTAMYDKPGHVSIYDSWLPKWKQVRKLAHTTRQNKLAKGVYMRARDHISSNLKHMCSSLCLNRDAQAHFASMSEQVNLSHRILEETAAEHGFVMFGDLMFHPDDGLEAGQNHDAVGSFLTNRARMIEDTDIASRKYDGGLTPGRFRDFPPSSYVIHGTQA